MLKQDTQTLPLAKTGCPTHFTNVTGLYSVLAPLLVLANAIHKGELLEPDFNESVVALLGKTDSPSPSPGDFRPISLLNADYKILAGVIALRLKAVLPSLVHETQTGFVPQRLILENLAFNRDLIDWSKATRSPAVLAFLDFEKAFDRVSWSYRDAVLRKMGFPEPILHSIHALYHSASCALNVNGKLSRTIHQGRGVRQGCPLSPFLFALFVEPLGELLRDHADQLGIQLPVTRGGLGGHHILVSQFADDTTLYSDDEAKIRAALDLVVTEFCAAAGARLNIIKTRILHALAGDAPPLPDGDNRRLRGDDFVKSLGGIYSEKIPPAARFDKVMTKIEARMVKVQSRYASIMARVLLTNSLLSSCIWFFAYFITPSPTQVERFDAIIWGGVWGKEPGDINTRGLVRRARMTAARSVGGVNILLPSIMIPSLQANMICRALSDRGRWWTIFLEWQLEKAEPTRRGMDALLMLSTPRRLGSSSFWKAATRSWQLLGWTCAFTPEAPRPRENWASLPLHDHRLIPLRPSPPARIVRAMEVLQEENFLYFSDMWDYVNTDWISHATLRADTTAARSAAGITLSELREASHTLKQAVLNSSVGSETWSQLYQLREPLHEDPMVGQHWGELDSNLAGTVAASSDASLCGLCTHGNTITLSTFPSQGGCGCPLEATDAITSSTCSCKLSRLLEHQGRTVGRVNDTILSPTWALGTNGISVQAEVKEIRSILRALRFPKEQERPACEQRWETLLNTHLSTSDWEACWKRASGLRVSGSTRSLLWKILHRRLPLLRYDYIRDFYGGCTEHCLLCNFPHQESYIHLFNQCAVTQATIWSAVREVLLVLSLPTYLSFSLPACLLGHVGPQPPTCLDGIRWGSRERDVPSPSTLQRLLGNTWGEVRGVAIQSTWLTRNSILHTGPLLPPLLRSQLTYTFWSHLRSVAVGKIRPPSDATVDTTTNTYNQRVWGLISTLIRSQLGLHSIFSGRAQAQ